MVKKRGKLKNGVIKKIVGLGFFLLIILFTVLAIINVNRLDILPNKYFYILVGVEVLFNIIIGLLLLKTKKIGWFILGIIMSLLMIIGNFIVGNYFNKTNKFINKTFAEYMTVTTDYVVVTSGNNSKNTMDEVEAKHSVDYYKYSRDVDLAIKELGDYTYNSVDSFSHALNSMNSDSETYLLIGKADYDYAMEGTILYDKNNYKIIKEFSVEKKIKVNKEVKDSYTIYLNGTDFTGIMRDFNLLITINTKTKKILTTSILRGYYIDVPAYNKKDTLMCLGAYDSNVSKEALEKLFNTKIDYIVNVNTNSLVDIVDTIGGVEFCSDYEFTTTHVLTDNTYNDSRGKKITVSKGCREYNGLEALAIARERLNLRNNERGRIENCQKIMSGIIKKSMTTTSLLNFEEVLNSYSDLYTTDMNRNVVTNLAKSFISNYNDYEITSINLDGIDGTAMGHLETVEVGVTFPDYDQVNEASKRIKAILEG